MPIKRITAKDGYTIIPNIGLEDCTLSAKAKGLLAYMLSKSDDWIFYQRELQEHFTDGKASIRSAMSELIEHGYIVKDARGRNDKGQLQEPNWIIYDVPQPRAENQKLVETPVNQQSQNKNAGISTFSPISDYPTFGNPTFENRQLPITDYTKYLQDQLNNNKKGSPETEDKTPKQKNKIHEDVITLYRENASQFKQYEAQKLLEWVEDFKQIAGDDNTAHGIVCLAVRTALDNGAMKMSYIDAILRPWIKNNVATVEMAQAQINAHRERRTTNSGGTGGQQAPVDKSKFYDLGF